MESLLSAGLAVALAGCAQVNLNTPESLQVDVENKGGISAKGEKSPLSAAEERRMLSHQVQELKNDRKAGEGKVVSGEGGGGREVGGGVRTGICGKGAGRKFSGGMGAGRRREMEEEVDGLFLFKATFT